MDIYIYIYIYIYTYLIYIFVRPGPGPATAPTSRAVSQCIEVETTDTRNGTGQTQPPTLPAKSIESQLNGTVSIESQLAPTEPTVENALP